MRLLHVTELKLYEFLERDIPFYAILSHRWEVAEVTFQDLQDGRGSDMLGWAKIQGCCAQAASDGFDYVWIDSCCIDKSSSAELSEAINSMYKWYQQAEVCYAFLSDVPLDNEHRAVPGSAFRRSKWFTRGWTLQELLAPKNLIFYDQKWAEIGTKSSLKEILEDITGIKTIHLFHIHDACVAQKMSWASKRETTRLEDEAYCLMGLFQVNMPPLYGEGERAFERLQLEILRTTDDASLFAWCEPSSENLVPIRGLLASSPECFRDSGDVRYSPFDLETFRSLYSMTNRGLQIQGTCIRIPNNQDEANAENLQSSMTGRQRISIPLSCTLQGEPLAVSLTSLWEDPESFCRDSGQGVISMTKEYRKIQDKVVTGTGHSKETLYVVQRRHGTSGSSRQPNEVIIQIQQLKSHGYLFREHYFDIGLHPGVRTTDPYDHKVEKYEDRIVWTMQDFAMERSLLLYFYRMSSALPDLKYRRQRYETLNLQIFSGRRNQGIGTPGPESAGLRLFVGEYSAEEFKDLGNQYIPRLEPGEGPDQDRVQELLPGGNLVAASVKKTLVKDLSSYRVFAHPAGVFKKKMIYLVDVKISTEAPFWTDEDCERSP